MKEINLGNLTQDQLNYLNELISSFDSQKVHIRRKITPEIFKYIKAIIMCSCGNNLIQYFKLAKYTDGSWVKDSELSVEQAEKELCNELVEICKVSINSCFFCKGTEWLEFISADRHMRLIREQYLLLEERKARGEVSDYYINSLIRASAYQAAKLTGRLSVWRTFLPKELRK